MERHGGYRDIQKCAVPASASDAGSVWAQRWAGYHYNTLIVRCEFVCLVLIGDSHANNELPDSDTHTADTTERCVCEV